MAFEFVLSAYGYGNKEVCSEFVSWSCYVWENFPGLSSPEFSQGYLPHFSQPGVHGTEAAGLPFFFRLVCLHAPICITLLFCGFQACEFITKAPASVSVLTELSAVSILGL